MSFLFPGAKTVTAFKDLWIIGDDFVNKIYHSLPSMNAKAHEQIRAAEQKAKRNMEMEKLPQHSVKTPYVYNYFNIRCFTSKPASTNASIPARLVNCLIKTTNEIEKLPRIIVVVPDWDILKFINHTSYGVVEITDKIVRWIVTNMQRTIDARKDRLMNLKPGALATGEPKVIWVKMINRLAAYDQTLKKRCKYNAMVENILVEKSNHYLIDLHPMVNDANLFTALNDLNGDGCFAYWKEFDTCIKGFDTRQLTLMPEKDGERKNSSVNQSAMLHRFKLPPIPPAKKNKTDQ